MTNLGLLGDAFNDGAFGARSMAKNTTLSRYGSGGDWCLVIVVCLLFLPQPVAANAKHLKAMNVEWQPYYFREHERIVGYAREIVDKVVTQAGLEVEFSQNKWNDVLERGLSSPNTIIAGIGRTPKRESLFYWVGPINKEQDVYAYGLKANATQLNDLDDLKKYLSAVERNMYYHDFMVKMGFEEQTYPVSDVSSLIKLLMSGRVDFILMERERMEVEFNKLGHNIDAIEAKVLLFSAQSYMTLSKASDPEIYSRLKESYLQLQLRGDISLH